MNKLGISKIPIAIIITVLAIALALSLGLLQPEKVTIKVDSTNCFIQYSDDACVFTSDGQMVLTLENQTDEKLENLQLVSDSLGYVELASGTFDLNPKEKREMTVEFSLNERLDNQTANFSIILQKDLSERVASVPESIKVVRPKIKLEAPIEPLITIPSCEKELKIEVVNDEKELSFEKIVLELETGTNDIAIIHPEWKEQRSENKISGTIPLGSINPQKGEIAEVGLKALEDKASKARIQIRAYWEHNSGKRILLKERETNFTYPQGCKNR